MLQAAETEQQAQENRNWGQAVEAAEVEAAGTRAAARKRAQGAQQAYLLARGPAGGGGPGVLGPLSEGASLPGEC